MLGVRCWLLDVSRVKGGIAFRWFPTLLPQVARAGKGSVPCPAYCAGGLAPADGLSGFIVNGFAQRHLGQAASRQLRQAFTG